MPIRTPTSCAVNFFAFKPGTTVLSWAAKPPSSSSTRKRPTNALHFVPIVEIRPINLQSPLKLCISGEHIHSPQGYLMLNDGN